LYFEELDGSHKFTHVETGAVSTRKKRDYSPISLCALIQRVAGFTLPGQKMMLWNWTPAAVLLDDVLMVTYHKNSRSIACNTHSLLHFFLHYVQIMHWCKVYTSGMRTTGKIVPPTKHRYRTEDLIMFCRCLVVGNE